MAPYFAELYSMIRTPIAPLLYLAFRFTPGFAIPFDEYVHEMLECECENDVASRTLVGSVKEMQTRTRIRVDVLDAVRRALESAPKNEEEEVTKLEAIRLLVPQIHAAKAKGYSLESIATMVSAQGLPVSAVALRSYLSQVKGSGGKKMRRKERPPGAASVGAVSAGAHALVVTQPASEAKAASTPPASRGVERAPHVAASVVRSEAPHAAAAAPGRKSSFEPKADSDEI
jgi:hypothetical protein